MSPFQQQQAELIALACQAECRAAKPGNVHPSASFDDLTVDDFRTAARLSAPHLARANEGVGAAIEAATIASNKELASNVNLGICLLLAPLAAASNPDQPSVERVLAALTVADAEAAYRAIRLAAPGGLGQSEAQDVAHEPAVTLLEAMEIAAKRDGIAHLYTTSFSAVFDFAVPTLLRWTTRSGIGEAIVRTAVAWHARYLDTHIARRAGLDTARQASSLAKDVANDWSLLAAFDRWLREDGHKRNPGTTADVVAATLYLAVRQVPSVRERISDWLQSEEGQ